MRLKTHICSKGPGMATINTVCPHCERDISIVDDMQSSNWHTIAIDNSNGDMRLYSQWNVCPNPECNKTVLEVTVYKVKYSRMTQDYEIEDPIPVAHRRLIPKSSARVFPQYVPIAIREDYEEACAIVSDSPKASATLARRTIQGIVRDFYKVKPGNLANEIEQLIDNIDADIWGAINAVRSVGNIGAHMEKDIDVIIPVDEGEAELLIELIETLVDDCYIARHKWQSRLGNIISLGAAKQAEREMAREAKTNKAKPDGEGAG